VRKTLILIGGGHAHVEVLRQLALEPRHDLDLALFDPNPMVWYSGMLPGVIAGHFEPAEAKLNLWALCQRARVRYFETPIVALHGDNQRVESGLGERHRFDIASIDVGSVSKPLPCSPGAYVVRVKPIDQLLAAINEREAVRTSAQTVRVIGGGAAAVEVALALAWRWRDAKNRHVSIVSGALLLDGQPPRVRKLAMAACRSLNVDVFENRLVEQVEPTRLRLLGGDTLDTQLTILATGYAPAPLLEKTAVAHAVDGSIQVTDQLRSTSHPSVFAAGDCATIAGLELPKSGVYAVRQGPLLANNLLAALDERPLECYQHNPQALHLISLGDKRAIAARNGFSAAGGWIWRWKQSIDRKWMAKYAID